MRTIPLMLLGLLLTLAGCQSAPPAGPTAFRLGSGTYEVAFNAARDVLSEYRFELDRIDARGGVLTTRPKATSGLATPWDREQVGLDQELEDLASQQQRRVRISFLPEGSAAPAVGSAPDEPAEIVDVPVEPTVMPADMLEYRGRVAMRVSVRVERLQRPGWRPGTKSVGLSTFTVDPELERRGQIPAYFEDLGEDRRLASKIASEIAAAVRRATRPTPPPRR